MAVTVNEASANLANKPLDGRRSHTAVLLQRTPQRCHSPRRSQPLAQAEGPHLRLLGE